MCFSAGFWITATCALNFGSRKFEREVECLYQKSNSFMFLYPHDTQFTAQTQASYESVVIVWERECCSVVH